MSDEVCEDAHFKEHTHFFKRTYIQFLTLEANNNIYSKYYINSLCWDNGILLVYSKKFIFYIFSISEYISLQN